MKNFSIKEYKRKNSYSFAPSGHSDLPLWKNIVAGGVAGTIEILAMYPTGKKEKEK